MWIILPLFQLGLLVPRWIGDNFQLAGIYLPVSVSSPLFSKKTTPEDEEEEEGEELAA